MYYIRVMRGDEMNKGGSAVGFTLNCTKVVLCVGGGGGNTVRPLYGPREQNKLLGP